MTCGICCLLKVQFLAAVYVCIVKRRPGSVSVQGNETAMQLEKDDKEGKVPKEMYNNYTVISYSEGEYSQVAYATYFKEEIAEIVSLFDAWIAGVNLARSTLSACIAIKM